MASKLPEGIQELGEIIQREGTQEEAILSEEDLTAILPEGAPTPRAAKKRERVLDEKEQILLIKAARFFPTVDPFPRNGPTIERKTFPFDKKDATGDEVRDSLKKIALYKSDLVGDKRRQILRLLPLTRKNEQHILKLRDDLFGLNMKLKYRLQKLHDVDPNEGECPRHFDKFPELLKKH